MGGFTEDDKLGHCLTRGWALEYSPAGVPSRHVEARHVRHASYHWGPVLRVRQIARAAGVASHGGQLLRHEASQGLDLVTGGLVNLDICRFGGERGVVTGAAPAHVDCAVWPGIHLRALEVGEEEEKGEEGEEGGREGGSRLQIE